jgi:hypothetical protein
MGSDRPFWVGLVCWTLIIAGMRGVYNTMKVLGTDEFRKSMSLFPYSATVAETIVFATLVVMVVGGICMYERQGWARWVYLLAMPVYFVQRFLAIIAPMTLPADQGEPQDPLTAIQSHLAAPPSQTKEELMLAALFVLYAISLWLLFSLSARRFFHPPMYVDE